MKVLVLNPHRSDFIYKSVGYSFLRRKSLQKYAYLQLFFDSVQTDFICKTSSAFGVLKKFGFGWLDRLLVQFEKRNFARLNNVAENVNFVDDCVDEYDVIFGFGFSIRDLSDQELKRYSTCCKRLIIHLSHYHLFAERLDVWAKFGNTVFCADADIRENIFYRFFVRRSPEFFVLSYVIEDRFRVIQDYSTRKNMVISTGTFHRFEEMWSRKRLKKHPLSGIFSVLSLHPERRVVNAYADKLPFVESRNGPMGSITLWSILWKSKKISQKGYFAVDIVKLYNEYKFAFVGEESVTGLPGIGILEAVACGCIPIINKRCYKSTPLENASQVIFYSSIHDLIEVMEDPDKHLMHIDWEESMRTSEQVKSFYSPDHQIKALNKFLDR